VSRAMIVLNQLGDRMRATEWLSKAPDGTRVTFQTSKRSLPQNSLMWAALTDVARQKQHHGRRYTPDQWKVIFMHACGREVQFLPSLDGATFIPWGQSSSELSKEEMTDLIEFILSWGAENGVVFHQDEREDAA
jgi:NinB protein